MSHMLDIALQVSLIYSKTDQMLYSSYIPYCSGACSAQSWLQEVQIPITKHALGTKPTKQHTQRWLREVEAGQASIQRTMHPWPGTANDLI